MGMVNNSGQFSGRVMSGRAAGAVKWTENERCVLLSLVESIHPKGQVQWQMLETEYNKQKQSYMVGSC